MTDATFTNEPSTLQIADPRELRDMVLRNDKVNPDLFMRFAATMAREGLHLDFKSGLLMSQNKTERNAVIRQYVAAFANSDGGTLVIGIREPTEIERKHGKPWALAPIDKDVAKAVDRAGLGAWVGQVTRDLLAYLGAPPRVQLIDVPIDGEDARGWICLIAVARAPSLVPLITSGDVAYFFRIEDQNQKVPPTLVADLLLGRRVAPHLVPTEIHHPEAMSRPCDYIVPGEVHRRRGDVTETNLTFDILNDSLVSARSIAAGIIVPRARSNDPYHEETPLPPLPTSLSSGVNFIDRVPAGDFQMSHQAEHIRLRWRASPSDGSGYYADIRPFERRTAQADTALLAGHLRFDHTRTIACALYLLPEGCPPQWFQINILAHGRSLERVRKRGAHVQFNPPTQSATVEVRTAHAGGVRPLVWATAPIGGSELEADNSSEAASEPTS